MPFDYRFLFLWCPEGIAWTDEVGAHEDEQPAGGLCSHLRWLKVPWKLPELWRDLSCSEPAQQNWDVSHHRDLMESDLFWNPKSFTQRNQTCWCLRLMLGGCKLHRTFTDFSHLKLLRWLQPLPCEVCPCRCLAAKMMVAEAAEPAEPSHSCAGFVLSTSVCRFAQAVANLIGNFLNMLSGSSQLRLKLIEVFSRMRSEGSRFIWGSGGEAVFAESCVYVRNRPRATATVCVTAVRLSTVASASGVVQKLCQVESCRRSYIGVCRGGLCESDLWRRSYIGVCRGGVCESDLWRRSYFGVCRGGVCESDLCRRSYIGVYRGGVCERDLCRRSYIGVCRGGVCGSALWRRSYFGVCRGGVCESDLCRRSYIGVCRGGVWESDLWRRSYIGVCRGGVSASDLCRRSYIGVCRGGVCGSDLWRRSYIGVCRGGVSASDLCRRSYIGVCRGGVCGSDLCRRSYIGVCRGGVCESDLCQVRVSYRSVK